jgi:hypothetical protein
MVDGGLTRWPSLSRDGMRPAPLVAEEVLPTLAVRNSRHFKRLPPVDSQACYKNLRGHPKPAIQGHLQSGHKEGMNCGRKLGCGKAGSRAALEIAERFPLSHNLNNNITLYESR